MIISVCGGKGGVGKSTLALNLAAQLDGVVVDADLGMADLPTDGGPTLHDVLAGRVDALAAVRTEWAVGILPSGRSLAGARAASLDRLEDVLATLDRRYEYVVVDTPAGFDADAALPIAAADLCVIVTTPDPATLADAVRTRSLGRELGTPLGAVVVNRSAELRPSITEVLGGPQFVIESDPAIHEAQRSGLPVALAEADPRVIQQFETVAAHLRRLRRDTLHGASRE